VLKRIAASPDKGCLIFPSESAGIRCKEFVKKNHGEDTLIEIFYFSFAGDNDKENSQWARFVAVIYPVELQKTVEKFWGIFGDGISSRHAEFCLERFAWTDSKGDNGLVLTAGQSAQPAPRPLWTDESDKEVKATIRSRIAKLISSDSTCSASTSEDGVLLYPKGMCAIAAVARALVPDEDHLSEVVVFG
jgi:cystathionine gamma-synthase